MLSPRACRRGRHHHHDSSGLPVHATTHSSDGGAGGERRLSVCPCFPHSWWRRTSRRHALVEIYLEPFSYLCRESSPWREAVGVRHRLPCLLAPTAGTATARGKFRWLCFRQPGSCPSDLVGLLDWGSDLPSAVFARILVDQLPKKRPLRIRLSRHRLSLPLGALGSRPSDCLKDGRCDGLWLQRAAPRLSYSTRGGHQSRLFDSDCQLSPFSIFDRQFSTYTAVFTYAQGHAHHPENTVAFYQVTGRIEIARAREIDIDDFLNRRRTIAHHQHAIGKLDGFFDVVGDKKNSFLFALPDPHRITAHF